MAPVFLFGACLLVINTGGISARSVGGEEAKCGLFQFYDHGTEDCEECRELCKHADHRGTQQQCRDSCADYLTAQGCRPDEYYDEHVRDCRPCLELCRHQQSLRTCRDKCLGFLRNETKTTPPPTLPPAPRDPHHKTLTPSSSTQHNVIVLVVLLLAIPIIGLLIALAFWCSRSRFRYARAAQKEGDASSAATAGSRQQEQQRSYRYPEAETQPGQLSELVANPTGT